MSRASRHRKSTNIWTDRFLPNKLEALQPPAAQIAPQPGFRRDVGTAKGTSTAGLAAWREGHGRSLHAAAPSRYARRPSSGASRHLLPSQRGGEGATGGRAIFAPLGGSPDTP